MLGFDDIYLIVRDCQYLDWRFNLDRVGAHLFLQIEVDGHDTKTGLPAKWRSRKWLLSRSMCPTEIVNTVFLAVEIAVRHELCEEFRYRGQSIKSPHWSADRLAAVLEYEALQPIGYIEARDNAMLPS
jgi:hypothetical protein